MSLEFPDKSSPNKKKFHPSLEGPRKGASSHGPLNGDPMETELSISFGVPSYPSESPVKEPSLQDLLKELQQREMIHFQSPLSFIFQSPRYTTPFPGSPARPLWRETPVSRVFLYISFRVPSKGAPHLPLQVLLTELP